MRSTSAGLVVATRLGFSRAFASDRHGCDDEILLSLEVENMRLSQLTVAVVIPFAFSIACGSSTMDESALGPVCSDGFELCDGECVSLASDPAHCGSCKLNCAEGLVCSVGDCKDACDTGLAACGRSCVDLMKDASHCGACGNPCLDGEACEGGSCAVSNGTGGSSSGGNSGSGGTGGFQIEMPYDPPEAPGITPKISFNHLGYELRGPKRAVIETEGDLSTFQVARAGAELAIYRDQLRAVAGFTEWGGGPGYYVADFSEVDEPGSYALFVNGVLSEAFEIGEDRYFDEVAEAILGYFEASRADSDAVLTADSAVAFFGSDVTHDVRGGWYDASGDISKYLSHLSYANFLNPQQIPLVAWGLAASREEGESLFEERGLVGKVQDEALWGADYLVRVLDEAGYFYMTVFDGWSGDLAAREICAYEGSDGTKTGEWQAAYREGGGMAIAALARISGWGMGGEFTSADYLLAAETAFAHLQQNNTIYVDDGIENIIDDYTALLAATELFAVTDDQVYLDAMRKRAGSLMGRIHATGYFVADGGARPFWHASDAGLPIVALSRYLAVEPDSERHDDVRLVIEKHLSYLVDVTGSTANPYGYARQYFTSGGAIQSGFFIPHDNESGYWWQGENARLASLAAAALIGGRAVGDDDAGELGVTDELAVFALDQLSWISGKNPEDMSFIHGFGRNNPPEYCSDKMENGVHAGGIANGITGAAINGSGIQWLAEGSAECWENWRWLEQWLPHATWYLVAATALAE